MEPHGIRYAAVYCKEPTGDFVPKAEYPPAQKYPRYAEIIGKVAVKESKSSQKKKCKLQDDACKITINYLTTDDGMFYASVSNDHVQTRINFALLQKLEGKSRIYWQRATERAATDELKKELQHYDNPANDKLLSAQKIVEETKGVMMENMEDMLNRGEKLEEMMQKTDDLQQDASQFHRKARVVRKNACWEDYKTKIILCIVVLAVLFIIVMIICNPNFSKCK